MTEIDINVASPSTDDLNHLVETLEAEVKRIVKERDLARTKFDRLAKMSEPFAEQTTESLRDLIATEKPAQITSWSKGITAALHDEGSHSLRYRVLRGIELYSNEALSTNPRNVRASRVHKILDSMFQFDN